MARGSHRFACHPHVYPWVEWAILHAFRKHSPDGFARARWWYDQLCYHYATPPPHLKSEGNMCLCCSSYLLLWKCSVQRRELQHANTVNCLESELMPREGGDGNTTTTQVVITVQRFVLSPWHTVTCNQVATYDDQPAIETEKRNIWFWLLWSPVLASDGAWNHHILLIFLSTSVFPSSFEVFFPRQANVAKLLIDDGVYVFHPLKLWSYWTEVHQMFTGYM